MDVVIECVLFPAHRVMLKIYKTQLRAYDTSGDVFLFVTIFESVEMLTPTHFMLILYITRKRKALLIVWCSPVKGNISETIDIR